MSSIPLPDISGRIDHMAFDPISKKVFIAALGNNSVKVVDLKNNNAIQSVNDLSEPQGIVFIPQRNAIVVANGGNGNVDFFNATSFQKITTIRLPSDADNVRFDSLNKRIYVGYGEGGIAIIDAVSFKQFGDIQLKGHPESFQLEIASKRMFVNIPDKEEIAVIDIEKQRVVQEWKLTAARSNFPMSLDDANHRLFIGCRNPAKLLVLDAESGRLITSVNTDSDVDDIFYDSPTRNIYLSCGGGFIDIINQQTPDIYESAERMASHTGARTSLLIAQPNLLIVASPKNFRNDATLCIYKIKN